MSILAFFTNWRLRDFILEIKYDLLYSNIEVKSPEKIDSIINSFEIISYDDLSQEYLKTTNSDIPKYKKLIKNLNYYKIYRTDLNQYIAGKYRLKAFLCKDDFYKDCVMNKSEYVICILNPKIFHKTLALINELVKADYNPYAFKIVNGHRHPKYNEKVGGASLSRHIKGEAVDISVQDINKDGTINKADKDIVLDLLETKIIKNEGGIGLYPGTKSVHYDVRGYRARWNTY